MHGPREHAVVDCRHVRLGPGGRLVCGPVQCCHLQREWRARADDDLDASGGGSQGRNRARVGVDGIGAHPAAARPYDGPPAGHMGCAHRAALAAVCGQWRHPSSGQT